MIVGIDLGTTNCACAIFRNGQVEMVPNSLGQVLTPSAVSVDDQQRVLTGLQARERQSTHPDRTVTAFKRYMGSNHEVRLGGLNFSPEELSALMLRSLKADAEAYLGETVEEAVITVPAYFNDKQRKATRRAGLLAGLKVERLINEPTAAALSYGIHLRDQQTRFLVFDLGGGTFDVSVLEIFEGVIEVRASAGDNRLGGEDFNELLIDMARKKFEPEMGSMASDNVAIYQRLREAAERTRRQLSDNPSATFSFTWKDKTRTMEVTATQFEEGCEPLIARLRDPVLRSLRDAGITSDSLNEIVLVGGSTRMPVVRKAVTRMFGRFPSASVNPDEAVARGAAVQAALKARNADLKEVVLTDVCPYTLGVASAETTAQGGIVQGIFTPIIERNCVIPASREETFSTLRDFQPEVEFPIFQGESRWVKDNIPLGTLKVKVPKKKAHEVSVVCRFSYDINGLLEVDVHVPVTGERRQLLIVDREGISPEDIERRRGELAKLKVHPRDSDANRATMARAGRCYENSIGTEREHIGNLISQFGNVLERQDPRACEAARKELSEILDRIEGQAFL
ncbi:MAG TPA: molecular chaperone HscC [Hyphomonadaceae bacterium]|jgi:molecular chaperone HscC|nr:molecular chaperone HscC [Hyphomonadaceae bacterium]